MQSVAGGLRTPDGGPSGAPRPPATRGAEGDVWQLLPGVQEQFGVDRVLVDPTRLRAQGRFWLHWQLQLTEAVYLYVLLLWELSVFRSLLVELLRGEDGVG
ncbi:hypothetical protein EYF80_033927 [Liparis tanakae]|uniref:Uncharacterized protein n=1 Tax=Liparis tanakae TaxID=230148 RepID=A0A4Z2GR40_9TELE|nr:hypothetical protein EYF80_033927 [Liparis tanakae]